MNKNNYTLLNSFLILSLTLFILSSCEKECPDGFSGKDCEDRQSDLFVASYEGIENCGFIDQFIELEIIRVQGPFDVKVNFIETPDFVLDATIQNDSIFFPKQWISTPQNSGSDTLYTIVEKSQGVLSNDTLRFSLSLLYPAISNQQWITCHYIVNK